MRQPLGLVGTAAHAKCVSSCARLGLVSTLLAVVALLSILDAVSAGAAYKRCLMSCRKGAPGCCPEFKNIKLAYYLQLDMAMDPDYQLRVFERGVEESGLRMCRAPDLATQNELQGCEDEPAARQRRESFAAQLQANASATFFTAPFTPAAHAAAAGSGPGPPASDGGSSACNAWRGAHDATVFAHLDGCLPGSDGPRAPAGDPGGAKSVVDVLLLRNPINRVVLLYLDEVARRGINDTNREEQPWELRTLLNFAHSRANEITLVLAGAHGCFSAPEAKPRPNSLMDEAARLQSLRLRSAMHNLQRFCVVLLYERLYEGLMYLHWSLGSRAPPNVRNVPYGYEHDDPRLKGVTKSTWKDLKKILKYDMRLYSYAQRRFLLQMRAMS